MTKFIIQSCEASGPDFKTGIIPGLMTVDPTIFGDSRGYFMETFNKELEPMMRHLDGSPALFVQDNESKSCRGVLRGLHFQRANPQAKLVRVIEGEVWDVAVDLRNGSPTFGAWHGELLTGENKRQFFVPEGFAHGFVVLSQTAIFNYKCTRVYDPSDESGLMWNDPDIGIIWPIPTNMEIQLSDKDKRLPAFADFKEAFRI